jgi:hypothetical protein
MPSCDGDPRCLRPISPGLGGAGTVWNAARQREKSILSTVYLYGASATLGVVLALSGSFCRAGLSPNGPQPYVGVSVKAPFCTC